MTGELAPAVSIPNTVSAWPRLLQQQRLLPSSNPTFGGCRTKKNKIPIEKGKDKIKFGALAMPLLPAGRPAVLLGE